MQTPKKHHYVPEFFIKNFSRREDKLVFIYDKQHENLNPVPKAASRICHDLHLYSLIDSGVAHPVLEGMYSNFEAQWKKSFELLSKDPVNLLLDNESTENIIRTFIAFQFWRNPSKHQLAALSTDNIINYYDKAKDEGNELALLMERKEIKKIVKNIHNKNARKILQYFVLPALTYSISKSSEIKYRIVKKPHEFNHDLICSDNPIIYPTIEDTFSKNEIRFFPLTNELALISSKEEIDITVSDFYKFQAMVFQSAIKWVFSSTPDTLSRVKSEVQHLALPARCEDDDEIPTAAT